MVRRIVLLFRYAGLIISLPDAGAKENLTKGTQSIHAIEGVMKAKPFLVLRLGIQVEFEELTKTAVELINADGRRGSQFRERTHAADAVPGIQFAGLFALALVALQKSGSEKFLG